MSILSKQYFHDEPAAFAYLESVLWPEGPVCPHCKSLNQSAKLAGKATRLGVYKCRPCRKQFTVKVGTVFESGHIPLHKMLQAVFLLCSSKKGISAHQLHRTLEITYKSAWFLAHRIREAMKVGGLPPLGGDGKIVEADETFIGKKKGAPIKAGVGHKMKVMSLVERGGSVRSVVLQHLNTYYIRKVLQENVAKDSVLHTDTAPYYREDMGFAGHERVDHSIGEYARDGIYTNTLEGYFSIFKRGMRGVYQHCSEKHLNRYIAEFDFRYNARKVTDDARANHAMTGIVGKRLLYKEPRSEG